MRLVAFITHSADVRHILDHIGADSEPPPIAPARGPPMWDGCDAQVGQANQPSPAGIWRHNPFRTTREVGASMGDSVKRRFRQLWGAIAPINCRSPNNNPELEVFEAWLIAEMQTDKANAEKARQNRSRVRPD